MPIRTSIKRNSIKKITYFSIFAISIYLAIFSDTIFIQSQSLLEAAERLIKQHPQLGMLIFVLISALSAMLAFFSSAILVPIGVQVWGVELCLLLLWSGWWLGGLCAYAVGHLAGNKLLNHFIQTERLEKLRELMQKRSRFWHILLFQAALPSEIPGYVLGSLRYSLGKYLAALALIELPYAVLTVYIGESFLQRNATLLSVFLILFLALIIGVHIIFQLKVNESHTSS